MDNNLIINEIIRYESSEFVNLNADRGGPTRWGITARTLGNYRNLGRSATIQEVKELDEIEARQIYLNNYIIRPGFDKIKNPIIRWFMVDAGVLHGPINPVNWLQTIVNVKRDGVLGPNTLRAMESVNPYHLLAALGCARNEAIGRLVTRDNSQIAFLNGWISRSNDLILKATLRLIEEMKKISNLPNLFKKEVQ